MEIRLQKIIELKGRLVLESNLHIGSGNMDMHIGGTDNPIIKHPHTLEPFIPGSSIKGKVRSLMELSSGVAQEAFKQNPNSGGLASLALFKKAANDQKKEVSDILKIFGFSGSDKSDEDGLAASLGPTRVSFADCYLNKEWKEKEICGRLQLKNRKLLLTVSVERPNEAHFARQKWCLQGLYSISD